jgi:gliding motility-associated-like protein
MKRATILVSIIFVFSITDLFAQIDSVQLKSRNYTLFNFTFFNLSFYNGDTIKWKDVDLEDYEFEWSVDDVNQVNDTLPVFNYHFTAEGNYKVKLIATHIASSEKGTDSLLIQVQNTILVPNVFSPNGDGINDDFLILSDGITPLEITIYSRTGVLVYKFKAPIINWDGRNSSGQEMSEGVYYYILKSDGPIVPEKTGFFHLYR